MGVTTMHPQYAEGESKWQKCRDAFDGGEAVKARGETYLPKLGGQNSDDYDAYLERALYYNATARLLKRAGKYARSVSKSHCQQRRIAAEWPPHQSWRGDSRQTAGRS